MSTTQLERRTIERTERLTNSVNGNPRFRFYFTDGSVADLSSDASFGYEAENPEYRPGRTVDVCFTRAGRVECMKPVKAVREYSASFAPLYPDGTEGDRVYALPADTANGALEALAAAIDGYGEPPDGLPVDEGLVPDALDITLTWKTA